MSIFSGWFQGLLDGKGWDQRQAATALHVRESTVHNWLHKDAKPGLKNVLRISIVFAQPIDEVARKAEYDDVPAFLTAEDAADGRAAILAALPQFADILDMVARKPPAEQAAYIAIIRRLLLDRPSDSESR